MIYTSFGVKILKCRNIFLNSFWIYFSSSVLFKVVQLSLKSAEDASQMNSVLKKKDVKIHHFYVFHILSTCYADAKITVKD